MALRQELDGETVIESQSKGAGGSPLYQIGFFLREPPKKGRLSRWIVGKTYGVDNTLPGVYPKADEVCALMERWRQRHSTEP